jgi:integrase
MRGKITRRSVDSLRPGADGRAVYLWDCDLAGFGAKASVGGVSFIVQYRRGGRGSPTRRVTLGRHGELTVDEARGLAKKTLGEVAHGGDPAGDKASRRKAGSVGDVVDRWLAEYVPTRLKPRTQADCRRFAAIIKRDLGSLPIGELSRARVAAWHADKAAAPIEANRALAWLSKVMNLAVTWELRHDNPTKGIERHRERARDRVLDREELARLGSALSRERRTPADAIRLAAMTGMRIGEVLSLDWSAVDVEHGEARLSDAKAGPRTVALGAAAVALLKDRPGPRGGRVFPVRYKAVRRAWTRACASAEIADARIHDLRHGALSAGAKAGASALLLRDFAGHKTVAMTNRYVARQVDPVRDLADTIAATMGAALGGRTGTVVALPKAAGQ